MHPIVQYPVYTGIHADFMVKSSASFTSQVTAMQTRTTFLVFPLSLLLAVFAGSVFGEEVLLEDYESGGDFEPGDWANSFEDSMGNRNASHDGGDFAVVDWATKWSGLPSHGPVEDYSRFTTFQVDVMVEKGQPVQEGSNFYFQLMNETDAGYAYWEKFVPQEKVPADGKWHRIKFRIDTMSKGHGDGGQPPTDFRTINGTVCGMTFDDEDDDKFKMKRANFDNLTLSDENISETTVTDSPKTVESVTR